jgi:hypothetical protein
MDCDRKAMRLPHTYAVKSKSKYMMSSMAPRSVRFGVRSPKLSNVRQSLDGWPKIYYLELLRPSYGMLSRWSQLHLQLLTPTNPHWARVVGYGPFSLCVIHKEGLCPSSGGINRLMMMTYTCESSNIIQIALSPPFTCC